MTDNNYSDDDYREPDPSWGKDALYQASRDRHPDPDPDPSRSDTANTVKSSGQKPEGFFRRNRKVLVAGAVMFFVGASLGALTDSDGDDQGQSTTVHGEATP